MVGGGSWSHEREGERVRGRPQRACVRLEHRADAGACSLASLTPTERPSDPHDGDHDGETDGERSVFGVPRPRLSHEGAVRLLLTAKRPPREATIHYTASVGGTPPSPPLPLNPGSHATDNQFVPSPPPISPKPTHPSPSALSHELAISMPGTRTSIYLYLGLPLKYRGSDMRLPWWRSSC